MLPHAFVHRAKQTDDQAWMKPLKEKMAQSAENAHKDKADNLISKQFFTHNTTDKVYEKK